MNECVCVCVFVIAGENLRTMYFSLLNTSLNSSISKIKLSNATFINQTLITINATILIKFITSVLLKANYC